MSAGSFWKNLEKMETENGRRKKAFFAEQPEYQQWLDGQPSRILGDDSLTKEEKLARYKEASSPDSDWTKLDRELTRRWSNSGRMLGKDLNVCFFL